MRIFAVRNNSITGTACAGTIALESVAQLQPGAAAPKSKDAGERAKPHHPSRPVLLKVLRGMHSIFVPSADGWDEVEIRLTEGQHILFCDFAPQAPPVPSAHFCYAGHWSKAGPAGAELEIAECGAEIDLDALDWQDGVEL